MSGGETSPCNTSAALSDITRRLDDLAATVARLQPATPAPVVPPGDPLDEATRARLARFESLLAVGPALGRDQALFLAVDRVIHGARADCAALFVAGPGGELEAVARRGFAAGSLRAASGEGIVGRALLKGEAIRAVPSDQGADHLLREHGVNHALALPLRFGDGPVVGILFAGRRRTAPFDDDAIEVLTFLADRVALLLTGFAPPLEPDRPVAVLVTDLDLTRVAATVVREAARLLGAPRVALLLPDGGRLQLAASVGVPAGTATPDPGSGAIAAALLSGGPWVAASDRGDEALEHLLGAPARLVVPLAVNGQPVALLVAGGPGPLAPGAIASLVAPAAAAIRNARLHAETVAALAELRRPGRLPEPPPPSPVRDFASLLAIVLSRIALVRERVADPAVGRELAAAEEAAWRAAEAVRGFLGFGPGHRPDTPAPLDLTSVIRAAVEGARRRWSGRGGPAPNVTLDLEPLPPIRGSTDDLREAIDQLVENAAEALPGGSITVRARWDGGRRVEVAVEDAGAGMDEAVRARALEPFFSTKGPGRLGLGLPVAQAVVAQHRGELDFVSLPGQGTLVRLTFPIAAGLRADGAVEIEGGRARILVVEDEAPVRDALVALLAQQGHVVLAAAGGREGLDLIQREPIDVVFTELAVPETSGLELGRVVKRLRPGTPVILVTAWPGRLSATTLEESGIDRVIEKPARAAEVLAAVQATLAIRRTPRA